MNKIVLLITFFSICHLAQAQFEIVDSDLRAKLNPQFEVFDSIYFNKIKVSDTQGRDTLTNGFAIIMGNHEGGKSYKETPLDSFWCLFKYYYPNGNIKRKGLRKTDNVYLTIGTWYYFDEQGNLTDSINYDKNFKFTFEQVLEFVKQEKKEDIAQYEKLKDKDDYLNTYYEFMKNPAINRAYYPDENRSSVWTVIWDEYMFERYYIVKLDGNTGEVFNRFYEKRPRRAPILIKRKHE